MEFIAIFIAAAAILFASTTVSFTLLPGQRELYENVTETCVAQAGVDMKMIEDIDAGKPFPTMQEMNCVIECMYDAYGFFDENGNFLGNKVNDYLALEFVGKENSLGTKCFGLSGATKCETSYLIQQCILYYVNNVTEL